MRIDLKSGEYLNYYNIKRVEIIENYIVKITGNFAKNGRNKLFQTHLRAIKNIRELNRFLKKEMKFYQVDGACPHCDSLNVNVIGTRDYYKRLNEPKEKMKYKEPLIAHHKCRACGKIFQDLKPVDLIIYYK